MGGIPRPSVQLPEVREEVLAGAVHEYKPPPSTDTAPTVPPPRDPRPPPRSSMVGVKVPPLAVPRVPDAQEEHEPTLIGIAPASEPPDDEGDRTTGEVSEDGLFGRYEAKARELAAERTRAATERARAEAAEKEAAALRERLPSAVVVVKEPDFDVTAYFKKWRDQALKMFIPIVAISFAGSVAIGFLNKANTDLRIDNTDATVKAQKQVTAPLPADNTEIKAYLRGLKEHNDCVLAQFRSAVERGTGESVTSVSDSVIVKWGTEEGMPRPPHGSVWERPAYFPTTPCPVEPALP